MKILFGLFLTLNSLLTSKEFKVIGIHKNSGLKVVSYESITLKDCIRLKSSDYQGWERSVYMSKDQDYCFKLWAQDFKDTSHFLYAIDTGFYKDIAPLVYLIIDKDQICRGYVCRYISRDGQIRMAKERSIYGAVGIRECRVQPDPFKRLYKTLIERMRKYNLIYHDISKDNFLFEGDRCYLIDLDALCFTHELVCHPRLKHIEESNPKDHVRLMHTLANEYFVSSLKQ